MQVVVRAVYCGTQQMNPASIWGKKEGNGGNLISTVFDFFFLAQGLVVDYFEQYKAAFETPP